jgi:glycosyltransferase involved in cell wall biosynthesis
VIPCYNHADYVGQAIQSALDQTYKNTEVIVIDDGSTDGSLDVIRSFGNAILFKSGGRCGACSARNLGLELANGELIQFLDADDLMHPEKLTRQVPLALTRSADVIYCKTEVQWVNRCQERTFFDSDDCKGKDPVLFALRAQIGTQAPIHWKSSLHSIGGFREHLPCGQEYDLHLRLACAGATFHHLPEVLVTERKLPGSISSNVVHLIQQRRRILWHAYGKLQKYEILNEERAKEFSCVVAFDARKLFYLGDTCGGIRNLQVAKIMHPSGGIGGLFFSRLGRIASRLIGTANACRLAVHLERDSA